MTTDESPMTSSRAGNGERADRRPGLRRTALVAMLCVGVSACGGGRPKGDPGSQVINNPPTPPATVHPRVAPVLMPSGCGTNGGLIIAEGAHGNGPPPAITAQMATALDTAIDSHAAIGVVSVEGVPALVAADRFSSTAGNPLALKEDRAAFLDGIDQAVDQLRATSQHVDDLAALRLGADAIHSACARGGTIYLADPGLQDTGTLDFSRSDLLGAHPADIVAFLFAHHELPDLTGIRVVLTGIGDTAPPQQPLDLASRSNLIDIWTAVVLAAHGVPFPDVTPRGGQPAADLPLVRTVPVPAPPILQIDKGKKQPVVVRLPDSGALGFKPDLASFRSPALAEAELAALARELISAGASHITLTGTTSSEGGPGPAAEAGRKDLSERRAAAVRDLLVQFGVAADRITTEGVGIHFQGYLPDMDAAGLLIPGPAAHNRSVIVTVTTG